MSTASGTAGTGAGTSWTNPTRAQGAVDASYATFAFGTSFSNANPIKLTNFGFSIPVGATINGIQFDITVHSSSSGNILDTGDVGDGSSAAASTKDGSTVAGGLGSLSHTLATTDEVLTYGGPSNLGGTTWSRSDINASTFGFLWSPRGHNSAICSVDSVTCTITYTTTTTFNVTANVTATATVTRQVTTSITRGVTATSTVTRKVTVNITRNVVATGTVTASNNAVRSVIAAITATAAVTRQLTVNIARSVTATGTVTAVAPATHIVRAAVTATASLLAAAARLVWRPARIFTTTEPQDTGAIHAEVDGDAAGTISTSTTPDALGTITMRVQ